MIDKNITKHLRITEPSPWITRFAALISPNGDVLDLACGGGRHSELLLNVGFQVTAVDKNTDAIEARLGPHDRLKIVTGDLETGINPFDSSASIGPRTFDGIIVVNYLYRDILVPLLTSLKPGGVLIYETFARGNEAFARPRNPDHLLRSGELLELVTGRLQVVAYEHGLVENSRPVSQ